MEKMIAALIALVMLPGFAMAAEKEAGFTVKFSVRVEPKELHYGETAELYLDGLESANMLYDIHWERTDLRTDVSRDEDRTWEELDAFSRTLTLEVTEESASMGYRAVLIAENNEEAISGMTCLEPIGAGETGMGPTPERTPEIRQEPEPAQEERTEPEQALETWQDSEPAQEAWPEPEPAPESWQEFESETESGME